MMIFKKAMPRRTFLRGVGTALALPLLDGMVPAFAGALDSASGNLRFSVVYVPNGIIMDKWTPPTEGANFELMPILEPLAPFRDRILLLSGLTLKSANPFPGEGAGDHPRSSAAFLTGMHAKTAEGSELHVGISVDQIAAKELGKQTQLASLELALDAPDLVGACESGYSCAYYNTISWRSETTPMPMENHPRAVFERLFGDTGTVDPASRLARIQENRSILDSVTQAVNRVLKTLGPSDQVKLAEYLDAIRDVERRIHAAEEQSSRELPSVERPVGIPATFDEHAKLMFDLQVLALQCDLTRVLTFMLGRELSVRTYREIGISDPHHPLTHHQNDPGKIAKVLQINMFHARMFAYFLEKLQSTSDGDGSLLDHTIVLYGGGISDGNMHLHDNLPVLLVAGSRSQIKGGSHVRYPKERETPMTNLHLALLEKLGIPQEHLGDSTGKLSLPA